MKNTPVIGITCARLLEEGPFLTGYPRTVVSTDYMEAVTKAGGLPIVLPPIASPEQIARYAALCDGLLVSGGKDVTPLLYGEMTHAKCGPFDPEVDRVHLAYIHAMLQADKPILGICRGCQLINVALGGTLYQDLNSQLPGTGAHMLGFYRWDATHMVRLTEGGVLAELFGKTQLAVNSFHHQAIAKLGEGLAVCAVSPDGVTESVTLPGKKVLGIQWHPEMLLQKSDEMLPIFRRLVEQCG